MIIWNKLLKILWFSSNYEPAPPLLKSFSPFTKKNLSTNPTWNFIVYEFISKSFDLIHDGTKKIKIWGQYRSTLNYDKGFMNFLYA